MKKNWSLENAMTPARKRVASSGLGTDVGHFLAAAAVLAILFGMLYYIGTTVH